MSEITLDSTSFSDQLGLYDFFNVLLSGAMFVFGLCIINDNLFSLVFDNLSAAKGIGAIIFIYTVGVCLQEVASYLDKKCFRIYKSMSHSVLCDLKIGRHDSMFNRSILHNSQILDRYRSNALCAMDTKLVKVRKDPFNDCETNGLIFSMYQYKLLVCGIDKKAEKLRALFNLSITLTTCFGLLAVMSVLSLLTETEMSVCIPTLFELTVQYPDCISKVLFAFACIAIAVLFYCRSIRTMRNFLLILYGTANIILEEEIKNKDAAECSRKCRAPNRDD